MRALAPVPGKKIPELKLLNIKKQKNKYFDKLKNIYVFSVGGVR